MRAFLKDPLTHFLAAGAAIFALASIASPPKKADNVIIVDRPALLSFIQYRSKAFEPKTAAKILDSLTGDARQRLIDDYIREEALDREAKKLGLDADDYVIRQRMVQKVEFLAEAAISPPDPTDAEIEAYYKQNIDRYRSPPSATFTHIFISNKGKTEAEVTAEARALLARAISDHAGFNDAPKYGDRFLFHKNYVDRTDDYIRSQIGDAATDAIFNKATPIGAWVGPFTSDYGGHLLFIASRAPARIAPLADIKETVKTDLMEEQKQAAINKVIDGMVSAYRIDDRTAK